MTHSSIDHSDLHAEVRRLIESRFPEGEISDVFVVEDYSEDGERLLLITAVFESSTDRFLANKPAGLMRFLRESLDSFQAGAMPLLSFVSASEAQAA